MEVFAILLDKRTMVFRKVYKLEGLDVWLGVYDGTLKPIKVSENRKYSIEDACNMVNEYYDNKVSKLTTKLKSEKYEDYKQERDAEKHHQIMKTAHNMVEDYQNGDIDEFINRLKVICQLKKELYSEKIPQIPEARKFNGTIKYQIKEINRERDGVIYSLTKDYFVV